MKVYIVTLKAKLFQHTVRIYLHDNKYNYTTIMQVVKNYLHEYDITIQLMDSDKGKAISQQRSTKERQYAVDIVAKCGLTNF